MSMYKVKGTIDYIRLQKESLWGIAEMVAPPSLTERLLTDYPTAFRDRYTTVSMIEGLSFPVVGVWPCKLAEGMEFSAEGDFKKHQTFGWQFCFTSAIEDLPTTNDGLRAYLLSGMVKGIGFSIAERIFQKFPDPLVIFEQDIDSLLLVDGIGKKKLGQIKESWEENGQMRNFIAWAVEKAQMTTGLAVKCFKKWSGRAQYEVEINPWVLATLPQVGFSQADLIAFNLGHMHDSPKRVEAGIKFILGQVGSPGGFTYSKQGVNLSLIGGQSFLPQEVLVETAAKMLEVDEEKVSGQITEMLEQGQTSLIPKSYRRGGQITVELVFSNGEQVTAVYLTKTHKREIRVAQRIKFFQETPTSRILTAVAAWGKGEWKSFFRGLVKQGIRLTDEQQTAVQNALAQKVSILTGGPGVGKTFVSKFIVDWLVKQGMNVVLATPTGKASRVLSQATGQPASTIHRLLGFTGNKFMVTAYDGEREGLDDGLQPVPDMIIIDETSMVDLWLVDALLMRVSQRTHILFVGDEDQLPSVGAGFVLGDLIASGTIPVSRLTKVHRQAEHSAIIKNARTINAGQTNLIARNPVDKYPDFFIATIRDRDKIVAEVVAMVTERIPDRFGFKIEDVQILTPRNGAETGTNALNRKMQAVLNPPSQAKAEHQTKMRTYRVGDPVMQIKNVYNKETFISWNDAIKGTISYTPELVDVFNGDQGVIVDYIRDHNGNWVFVVEIDRYLLGYTKAQLSSNLILSHAITCHKSQGGQFPVVVIALTWEHWALLSRKLIYTAITRAKEMVVIVAQPGKDGKLYSGPLGKAIRNNEPNLRHTALDWRLNQYSD